MKVGIVTQPLLNNYGGLLQNYALQQVLKKLGHEVKTIDFIYRQSFCRYLLSVCKQVIVDVLRCRRPQVRPYVKYTWGTRKPQMANFVANNIETTEIVYLYSSNIVRKEAFDAVITGSDQVWRPMYNMYLEDMYLKFVPNNVKKISYAASFGVDNWEYTHHQTSKCAKHAKHFHAVSVREQSAINLCKQYLNIDAQYVLDPTILAGAEAYQSLLQPYNGPKYLFAYILDITIEKENFIRDLANEKHLEIKIYGADKNASLSVEEWLSMIANAEIVITDSFHGSVFSILFHSEFYSIVNKERGGARFTSLLQPLGLEDHLLDVSDVNNNIHLKGIDWKSVDTNLEILRRNSLNFLTKALSHA